MATVLGRARLDCLAMRTVSRDPRQNPAGRRVDCAIDHSRGTHRNNLSLRRAGRGRPFHTIISRYGEAGFPAASFNRAFRHIRLRLPGGPAYQDNSDIKWFI